MTAVRQDGDDSLDKAAGPSFRGLSTFARLEQRVTSIEDSLREIKSDFRIIRDDISKVHHAVIAFGKPQYTVISGVTGVVLVAGAGLWGLAISPIQDDLSRLYSMTEKLTIRLEDDMKLIDAKKLDRASFDETKTEINARIIELNSRLKRQ